MIDKIDVGEVKHLSGDEYSVQLRVAGDDTEISNTETVSAGGRDAAIEAAKQNFANWLKVATDIGQKLALGAAPQP